MARQPSQPNPTLGKSIQTLMAMKVDVHSQPLLAKKSGVSQSTIGRIIRGEVSPSSDNLKRIADALGVDVAHLYIDSDALGLINLKDERVRAQETRFVGGKAGKTPLKWDLHVQDNQTPIGLKVDLKESSRGGFVIGAVGDGYAVRVMGTPDYRASLHGAFLLVEQTGIPANEDLCLVRLKTGETVLHEFRYHDEEEYFFESMWGQEMTIPQEQVEWIHGVVAICSPRQWRPR